MHQNKLPQGERLYSFVVIADTHINEEEHQSGSPFRTNAQANGRARFAFADVAALEPAPQFIVHLGDIVHPVPGLPGYDVAARQYHEIAQLVSMPIHLVPGNHDVGDKSIDWMPADIVSDEYLEKYRKTFGADYFDIDAGPLRLIVINAQLFNSGLPAEATQKAWIDAQLAAAGEKRVFIFLHYPPYLVHEDERSSYDNIDQPGRAWLLQRLRHERVEAVFAGHVHNFWYDALGKAEMYMLPSTAFLRHDFTEMYHVSPREEFGRGDSEKFGYFIVDVFEQGHVARLVRTHGGSLAPGADAQRINSVVPVHTKTSTLHRFGVELRHAWAEIVQIPATGGVQEFGRKPARNDYQLMALWEMGVITLKIPMRDFDDAQMKRRGQLMSDVGHDFVLTALGIPDLALLDQASNDSINIAAIEVNISIAKAVQRAESLVRLRASGKVPILLAHLRSTEDQHFDGIHFSHFVNAGLRVDELERNREAVCGLISAGAIDGITVRIDWGTDIVAASEVLQAFAVESDCEILVSVKLGTHSLALANQDDDAIASLAAQTVVLSQCCSKLRFVFDTFMDVDRGYFPRNGFIDRRFDPRPAGTVVAVVCAALAGHSSAELVGNQDGEEYRTLQFRSGDASFVLICAAGRQLAGCVRSAGPEFAWALDLSTGHMHESSNLATNFTVEERQQVVYLMCNQRPRFSSRILGATAPVISAT